MELARQIIIAENKIYDGSVEIEKSISNIKIIIPYFMEVSELKLMLQKLIEEIEQPVSIINTYNNERFENDCRDRREIPYDTEGSN